MRILVGIVVYLKQEIFVSKFMVKGYQPFKKRDVLQPTNYCHIYKMKYFDHSKYITFSLDNL